MRVTIEIPSQNLLEKILWLLNSFKNEGVEIVSKNSETSYHKESELDFSSFKIDSFSELDGLKYQKMVRDEW